MKKLILLFPSVLLFFISSAQINQGDIKQLDCTDYWAKVPFSDFCGLSKVDFKMNDPAVDNCNADISSTYAFDDLVYIRVDNNYTKPSAQEYFNSEKEFAESSSEQIYFDDLGDAAFGVLEVQFGELDKAVIQILSDVYTIYFEVNGKASNGANNCFDENSVVEFARGLVEALE